MLKILMCAIRDSNPWPTPRQGVALPTELTALALFIAFFIIFSNYYKLCYRMLCSIWYHMYMNLVYEILKELSNTSLRYKGTRVNLFGIPKFKNYSQNSLSGTLSRLYRDGFIEDVDLRTEVTLKGKKYLKRKYDSLKQFNFKFEKDAPKNLIVMFDIPETKKAEREWLRWHLKKFNYSMIQKSVWVGPSPLPKEFLDYIETIKIKDGLKTFKLAKGYDFKK